MRDDRRNQLTVAGERTDSTLLDQQELVGELGGFVQGSWPLNDRWLVSAGARRDAVSFRVIDRHFGDGADNSGRRVLAAWSANGGASVRFGVMTGYATLASAFETPTTTELANAPGVTGGFNPDLAPQRTVSVEAGVRGAARSLVWSLAAFRGRISDAIVQFEEVGGRAFFRNAGRLHQDGVELAAARAVGTVVTLRAAYTWSRLRFGEYRPVEGTAADTLDGNRVPGVPEHFLRGALEARLFGAVLRVDQSVASRVFADDRNTIAVDGWNVTDLGLSWETRRGSVRILPNGGLRNVFGNRYSGSVTVNGAFGRVFEPAPGRNGWIGVELRFDRVRASSPDPGL
jgi:iron complex outermembrane receptor protein